MPTEKALACEAASGGGLPKGWHVSFRHLALPQIGERSVAWQYTIKTPALPGGVYADIVFANKGRTFAVLALTNFGTPFEPKLARRLVLAAGARLSRYGA